jgi:hypothetical protein
VREPAGFRDDDRRQPMLRLCHLILPSKRRNPKSALSDRQRRRTSGFCTVSQKRDDVLEEKGTYTHTLVTFGKCAKVIFRRSGTDEPTANRLPKPDFPTI